MPGYAPAEIGENLWSDGKRLTEDEAKARFLAATGIALPREPTTLSNGAAADVVWYHETPNDEGTTDAAVEIDFVKDQVAVRYEPAGQFFDGGAAATA